LIQVPLRGPLRAARSGVVALPGSAVVRGIAAAGAVGADLTFLAFVAAAAAVRWSILRPLPLPPGADGGNWLALGRALWDHAMPGGVVYPPLVPALALAAEWIDRPIGGLKLIAVASSVMPSLGCYAAARICGLRWMAAIPCAFLAVANSVGEATAWGGYPQLVGLGLMPVALALLDLSLRTWRAGLASLSGLAFAATLAADEMVGAVAVLAAALLVGVHLIVLGARPPSPRRFLLVAAVVAAPSIVLAATYVQLLAAIYLTYGPRPVRGNIALRDFFPYAFRDLPAFWYPAMLLAGVAPAAWFVRARSRTWPLVLAILASSAILFVGLRQVRFGYVVPVAAVLGVATWLDAMEHSTLGAFRRAAPVAALALIPVLGYQSIVGVHWFREQVRFYQVVPGDWVQAMSFLRLKTPPGAVVAVGPNDRGDPTGWWVQGLGERPALISSDPAWLDFPDERARSQQALWIFDPTVQVQESLRRARSSGVAYLLVDKRWSGYGAWRREPTLHVVLDEADVAVVKV